MANERGKCEVCGKRTRTSSPLRVISRYVWWCRLCQKKHILPYGDMVLAIVCSKDEGFVQHWNLEEYIKFYS
jgi:hypothetical protein